MHTRSQSTLFHILLLSCLTGLSQASPAQDNHHAAHHAPTASAPASTPWVEGEIRSVDVTLRKITLRHGDIPNLDMPGMTMVFKLGPDVEIGTLAAGAAVRFSAELINGEYTLTRIEPRP